MNWAACSIPTDKEAPVAATSFIASEIFWWFATTRVKPVVWPVSMEWNAHQSAEQAVSAVRWRTDVDNQEAEANTES